MIGVRAPRPRGFAALVSGVIASGYSAAILDAARREMIQLVTSNHMLKELGEVILRPPPDVVGPSLPLHL